MRLRQKSSLTPPALEWSAAAIETLVRPMLLHPLPVAAYQRLAEYVLLLYRWNDRMNLTAVGPEEWVRLHVAECLRCAQSVPQGVATVLDFGSGGGLPGIPMQIARPELCVTLAESQNKKAAFLREAVRALALARAQVYAGRVEDLPPGQSFDLVALRAVDRMSQALHAAGPRIRLGGWCMVLTSVPREAEVKSALPLLEWAAAEAVPGTRQRIVLLGQKRK